MKLVLAALLIGKVVVTSYRSVPNQTDSSPYYTSIGEHVHPHGVALSRDLLKRWGGPIDYGDTIYVEGIGLKVVNDCMNERYTNRVDVWVATYDDEKRINVKRGRVWLIKPIFKDNLQ